MKFLILNTDYPEFLHWLYTQHASLEAQPYDEQMRVRNESLFSVADFYSNNLRKLGNEAWDLHVNNEFMQKAWAKEQGIRVHEPTSDRWLTRAALNRVRRIAGKAPLHRLVSLLRPLVNSLSNQASWFYDILLAQIKYYQPDVLINQAMDRISSRFLGEIKPYMRLLMGQHAATRLNPADDWRVYDLVVSSFPPTIEWFRSRRIPAQLHRLGFEPKVFSLVQHERRTVEVSFVGSVFPGVHRSRIELLEGLCQQSPIRIWGHGIECLSKKSPIRSRYAGPAWGLQMYEIIRSSKITLNHHGDILPYANNMRLYEATGVGTLLITDWKANLHEMFEPDKEVITYRDPEECVELIHYYLKRENEGEAIARAGQQRTLREHTYYHRMQELEDIISRHLHTHRRAI